MQEYTKTTLEITDEQKRAKSVFNISIATGIIFVLITISVMFINQSARIDVSLALVLFTAILAFFSAWLSGRGKSQLGILLVIFGLLLTTTGRIFVQKGLAIPTGITNIILISTIAIYTLPPKWLGRVIALSFMISVGTIIADQFTVGISASPSTGTGMVIALSLGIIYLVIFVFQFPKFTLGIKLVSGFIFLSTLPLIILGVQTYQTSRTILQEQVKASLSESSLSASTRFENFTKEQIKILASEASYIGIIRFVSTPAAERENSDLSADTLNALYAFSRKDKDYIISYALLDVSGLHLLDTTPANLNSVFEDPLFKATVIQGGQPYISEVRFPPKFNNPVLYFAVPIFTEDNRVIGALLVTYNAGILQHILETAVQNQASGTGYAFVLDDTYFVNLAHSSKPDLIYKSYLNIDETAMLDLQSQKLLPQGSSEYVLQPQIEVVGALQAMGPQTSYQAPSLENNNEPAESAAARIDGTGWIVVSSQPVSAISVLIEKQTRVIVIASSIILIFTAIIALIISNFYTAPIIQLTKVAEKISSGDFSQKAKIASKDEISTLGRTFNTMSTQIQELIENLEKRVEERTSNLEATTLQSEKRAREMQTVTEVARHISTEKDLGELLRLITRIVSERFGFYHVGIFLLSENQKYAVLRAANSAGGQRMLLRQHKLEVGQTGIVGNATATGIPRIAHDTGADAIYFNNPDLPDTRSEMALPLSIRGEIIGALDVQSTIPNAFSDSDIALLSLLADQVATAIDNARLLAETQKALAESQSVFREYTTEAWQKKTTSSAMGYHHTISGGHVLTSKNVNALGAIPQDDMIDIPIRLRDQVIGTLQIKTSKENESLSADQINIIESVTERLGLALDNARLFEETSTRAARERLVSEITTKIRSTNDPQEMIKTAMEELKHALGAKQIEIIPQGAQSTSDG